MDFQGVSLPCPSPPSSSRVRVVCSTCLVRRVCRLSGAIVLRPHTVGDGGVVITSVLEPYNEENKKKEKMSVPERESRSNLTSSY